MEKLFLKWSMDSNEPDPDGTSDGPQAKREKLDVLIEKSGNTGSEKVVIKRLDVPKKQVKTNLN